MAKLLLQTFFQSPEIIVRASLEYLYHFQCEVCLVWWSQADLQPQVGDRLYCPHCGHRNTVEKIETFLNSVRGSCLQRQPDPERR